MSLRQIAKSITFSFFIAIFLLPFDSFAKSKTEVGKYCNVKEFSKGTWKVRIDPRNQTAATPGRAYMMVKFNTNGTIKSSASSAYDYYNDGSFKVVVKNSGIIVQDAESGKACQVIFLFDGTSKGGDGGKYDYDVVAAGYVPGMTIRKAKQGIIMLTSATTEYGGVTKYADVYLERITVTQ